MFGWFRGRRSKETLKDRLELVLAYDRAKIAPGKVEALRNDLLEVVQRYFPSGDSKVDIEQDGEKVVLMASISIDEASGRDDFKDLREKDKDRDKEKEKDDKSEKKKDKDEEKD